MFVLMPRTPSKVLPPIFEILLVSSPFISFVYFLNQLLCWNSHFMRVIQGASSGTSFIFICSSCQGLLVCPFLSLSWTKCSIFSLVNLSSALTNIFLLLWIKIFFQFSQLESSSIFPGPPSCTTVCSVVLLCWTQICLKVEISITGAYCQALHLPSLERTHIMT